MLSSQKVWTVLVAVVMIASTMVAFVATSAVAAPVQEEGVSDALGPVLGVKAGFDPVSQDAVNGPDPLSSGEWWSDWSNYPEGGRILDDGPIRFDSDFCNQGNDLEGDGNWNGWSKYMFCNEYDQDKLPPMPFDVALMNDVFPIGVVFIGETNTTFEIEAQSDWMDDANNSNGDEVLYNVSLEVDMGNVTVLDGMDWVNTTSPFSWDENLCAPEDWDDNLLYSNDDDTDKDVPWYQELDSDDTDYFFDENNDGITQDDEVITVTEGQKDFDCFKFDTLADAEPGLYNITLTWTYRFLDNESLGVNPDNDVDTYGVHAGDNNNFNNNQNLGNFSLYYWVPWNEGNNTDMLGSWNNWTDFVDMDGYDEGYGVSAEENMRDGQDGGIGGFQDWIARGLDGCPGICDIDDDGNGIIDDIFELGSGDDDDYNGNGLRDADWDGPGADDNGDAADLIDNDHDGLVDENDAQEGFDYDPERNIDEWGDDDGDWEPSEYVWFPPTNSGAGGTPTSARVTGTTLNFQSTGDLYFTDRLGDSRLDWNSQNYTSDVANETDILFADNGLFVGLDWYDTILYPMDVGDLGNQVTANGSQLRWIDDNFDGFVNWGEPIFVDWNGDFDYTYISGNASMQEPWFGGLNGQTTTTRLAFNGSAGTGFFGPCPMDQYMTSGADLNNHQLGDALWCDQNGDGDYDGNNLGAGEFTIFTMFNVERDGGGGNSNLSVVRVGDGMLPAEYNWPQSIAAVNMPGPADEYGFEDLDGDGSWSPLESIFVDYDNDGEYDLNDDRNGDGFPTVGGANPDWNVDELDEVTCRWYTFGASPYMSPQGILSDDCVALSNLSFRKVAEYEEPSNESNIHGGYQGMEWNDWEPIPDDGAGDPSQFNRYQDRTDWPPQTPPLPPDGIVDQPDDTNDDGAYADVDGDNQNVWFNEGSAEPQDDPEGDDCGDSSANNVENMTFCIFRFAAQRAWDMVQLNHYNESFNGDNGPAWNGNTPDQETYPNGMTTLLPPTAYGSFTNLTEQHTGNGTWEYSGYKGDQTWADNNGTVWFTETFNIEIEVLAPATVTATQTVWAGDQFKDFNVTVHSEDDGWDLEDVWLTLDLDQTQQGYFTLSGNPAYFPIIPNNLDEVLFFKIDVAPTTPPGIYTVDCTLDYVRDWVDVTQPCEIDILVEYTPIIEVESWGIPPELTQGDIREDFTVTFVNNGNVDLREVFVTLDVGNGWNDDFFYPTIHQWENGPAQGEYVTFELIKRLDSPGAVFGIGDTQTVTFPAGVLENIPHGLHMLPFKVQGYFEDTGEIERPSRFIEFETHWTDENYGWDEFDSLEMSRSQYGIDRLRGFATLDLELEILDDPWWDSPYATLMDFGSTDRSFLWIDVNTALTELVGIDTISGAVYIGDGVQTEDVMFKLELANLETEMDLSLLEHGNGTETGALGSFSLSNITIEILPSPNNPFDLGNDTTYTDEDAELFFGDTLHATFVGDILADTEPGFHTVPVMIHADNNLPTVATRVTIPGQITFDVHEPDVEFEWSGLVDTTDLSRGGAVKDLDVHVQVNSYEPGPFFPANRQPTPCFLGAGQGDCLDSGDLGWVDSNNDYIDYFDHQRVGATFDNNVVTLGVGPALPMVDPVDHDRANDLTHEERFFGMCGGAGGDECSNVITMISDTIDANFSVDINMDRDRNAQGNYVFDVKAGMFEVPVSWTGYSEQSGQMVMVEDSIDVRLYPAPPEVLITLLTTYDVVPGQPFQMLVNISNLGEDDARDIDLYLSGVIANWDWQILQEFIDFMTPYSTNLGTNNTFVNSFKAQQQSQLTITDSSNLNNDALDDECIQDFEVVDGNGDAQIGGDAIANAYCDGAAFAGNNIPYSGDLVSPTGLNWMQQITMEDLGLDDGYDIYALYHYNNRSQSSPQPRVKHMYLPFLPAGQNHTFVFMVVPDNNTLWGMPYEMEGLLSYRGSFSTEPDFSEEISLHIMTGNFLTDSERTKKSDLEKKSSGIPTWLWIVIIIIAAIFIAFLIWISVRGGGEDDYDDFDDEFGDESSGDDFGESDDSEAPPPPPPEADEPEEL